MFGEVLMPDLREHCMLTEQRYGVTGRDIHKWMDEPVKLFGPNHRLVRHDKYQKLPQQFIETYGSELAYNIMLDHLLADEQTSCGLPEQIQRRRETQTSLYNISDADEIKPLENKEDLATHTPSLQTEAAQPNNTKRERLLALLNKIEQLETKIKQIEEKPSWKG